MVKNQVKIELENFEKCFVVCDADCPLGNLYDYACAFKAFVFEKMKAIEEVQKEKDKPEQVEDGNKQ